MNDEQLLRYSRQIMLPQIDITGQEKLLRAHVLVVGAGGLGSPAAMYLAAAGIGHITIADHDTVELSNLQRQLLHHDADLGQDKANSARASLVDINPDITVTALSGKLQKSELDRAVGNADVVLDCTDNFATRFDINRASLADRVPLVSAAAVRYEGQLTLFDPRRDDSPCYHCLYQPGDEEEQTCADTGVLSPVTGIIGTLQALETIKLLLGIGDDLCGRLVLFDALRHDWRTLKLVKDLHCPACGNH